MRFSLVFVIATLLSIQAFAWVESIRGVSFSTCNGPNCFKLKARTMERSLFGPYYFTREIDLQQTKGPHGVTVRQWHSARGMYDHKGNRWILLGQNGVKGVCLNGDTGSLETYR